MVCNSRREVGSELTPIIYVVDDDASVRKSLERLITSMDFHVEIFTSAQEFLRFDRPDRPCCLVLDIRMPGISGLDLQEELTVANYTIPIIFITGHGDIPMSVRAMKKGAVDFLTKPFDDQDLLDAIHKAIEQDKSTKQEQSEISEIQKCVDSLTSREREVFALIVTGMLNKQVAYTLKVSEKTVKVHRARVMQKMHAKSLAHLVRMADKVGIEK
ncbi:MAG: response regulator transcription factor [Candidatus Aminicenantes bacterium]|nr:MAG: response regulator transcription factor [Candidatus Aminicenantes bacterium]